jgi:hypothetical protein
MRISRKLFVVVGVVAVAAAVWAAQDTPILIMEGRTVSSNLRMSDGTLLVPVRDIATAFGYEVREGTGRVELVRSGASLGLSTSGVATMPFNGTLGLTAPRPRAELSSKTGEDVAYGNFAHRLIGVTYPGREYRQEFDSRRRKLRAPFDQEQLVVVRMSVTNRGTQTATAPTPTAFGASVFDETKVGYPVTAIDARQAGGVQSDDPLIVTNGASAGSVLLAPGGSVEYALVASIPRDRKVSQVLFNLSAPATETATSGALVTIDTAGE